MPLTKEWVVILISAGTDFIIASFGALTAAMLAKGDAMMPTYPVLLVSFGTGAVAAARTIQQALRRIDPSIIETTSVVRTTVTPPAQPQTPPVGDK